MIHGIFLDPRSWVSDFLAHPNWNPERFGVKIDLYNERSQVDRKPPGASCKFAISTEAWTVGMHKTLEFLKTKHNLKIFMIPRETILAAGYKRIMFKNKDFEYNGKCFFSPDVLMSSGQHYTSFWKEKAQVVNIGHPRYDSYAISGWHDSTKSIKRKYNIDPSKKVILFASYWNKHYQQDAGDTIFYSDTSKDLQKTTEILEEVAKAREDIQVVIKIHPTAQKLYLKGKYKLDYVTAKYFRQPDGLIRVVEDDRETCKVAKNLLYISDLVVGFKSTMMLEAMVINKPTINIMLEQANKLIGLPDLVERIFTVKSGQDLKNCLLDTDNYKNYGALDKSLIYDYFHDIDGNYCERLCNEIKKNI